MAEEVEERLGIAKRHACHVILIKPGIGFFLDQLCPGGRLPVNPGGGLIGCGHPVGATGARMLFDAARQVTGQAGEMQVEGARRFATLNIGGSCATVASFVVGVDG